MIRLTQKRAPIGVRSRSGRCLPTPSDDRCRNIGVEYPWRRGRLYRHYSNFSPLRCSSTRPHTSDSVAGRKMARVHGLRSRRRRKDIGYPRNGRNRNGVRTTGSSFRFPSAVPQPQSCDASIQQPHERQIRKLRQTHTYQRYHQHPFALE